MNTFQEYLEAISSNTLKFKMNSGNKVYNDSGKPVTGNLLIEFEPNDDTSETYYIFDERNVTFFRIQTKKDFTDLVYEYADTWDYEPQYSGIKEKVLLDGYLLGDDDEKLEKKISSFFGNKVSVIIEYNEY